MVHHGGNQSLQDYADFSYTVRARDLPNWVEVYLDGAWQILDPENDQLYPKFGDYVQLGIVDEANPSLGVWLTESKNYRVTF